MTYTDHGTQLPYGWDWCPLAVANGMEWASLRGRYKDGWSNLYRLRRAPLSWALWYVGAAMARLGITFLRR